MTQTRRIATMLAALLFAFVSAAGAMSAAEEYPQTEAAPAVTEATPAAAAAETETAPAAAPAISSDNRTPSETPAAEEAPTQTVPAEEPAGETPAAEETPVTEEGPAAEETPVTEEGTAAEETPVTEEGTAAADPAEEAAVTETAVTEDTSADETAAEKEPTAETETSGEEDAVTEDGAAEEEPLAEEIFTEYPAGLKGIMLSADLLLDAPDGNAAGSLQAGATVTILAIGENWTRVRSEGLTGYVHAYRVALYNEPEKVEKPIRSITVSTNTAGMPVLKIGMLVKLTARLEGFDQDTYTLQWQYSPDGGATAADIPGADKETYSYYLNRTNARYLYRLVVRYEETESGDEAAR